MAEHKNVQSILLKPRYNNEELKKAVDVIVDELVPPTKRKRLDLVPRERYDAVVADNNELNDDLRLTREQIAELETQISNLENEINQALIDVDEATLSESVAVNRAEALQNQFQQLNLDFREALQKSIQEGINKLSLQAQNDGLRAEVNALRTDLAIIQATVERLEDRLEGRQAEEDAGAVLLGTDVTVRNLQPPTSADKKDVFLYWDRDDSISVAEFRSGGKWKIGNTSTEPIEIQITTQGAEGAIDPPSNSTFALEANEDRTFDLRMDTSEMRDARPNGLALFSNAKNHDGQLIITLLGTGESLTFQMRFRKHQ